MAYYPVGSKGSISAAAAEILNTRRSINVIDSTISYLDTGVGDNAVIFLHGNPTSSFLWRNVIPHVKSVARCLAPDLIGMGHSGKPAIQYRFADHYRYLSAWIDEMNLPEKVTVVGQDWGSALGFHWGNQNQSRVRAIVYMEAVVASFHDWSGNQELKNNLMSLRSDKGEQIIVKENLFIEKYLPSFVMRQLADDEMEEYRAPYRKPGARLPMLAWPRQSPVIGEGPEDVIKIVADYAAWLSTCEDIPKLHILCNPGVTRHILKKTVEPWPNERTSMVTGLHFPQEDSPREIGEAISNFLKSVYSAK